ncbi:ester cyclase [Kocuria nitroreducens]|uniref:ester cyclase n=1 Tax=Kocuria nitroreducens TaxID=3058914 RepID=UPI0036D9EAA7
MLLGLGQQAFGEFLLIDDLSRHGIDHLLCPVSREVGHCRLLSDQAGPSHTVFLTVPHGYQAWQTNVEMMLKAFPDLHAEILDVFGQEDRVAVRLMFRGTHRGEFQGVAPTGREVRYDSIERYRVTDGRLAEKWIASDIATLMHQITGSVAQSSPASGHTKN